MSDDLTEDQLLGGKVVLRQPEAGFRAGIDSVLLAAAVPAQPGEEVVEPGAGAGAAALCLARRVAGVRVTGIERDAQLVRLAGENARLNGLQGVVTVMVGDVRHRPARLAPSSFDHVMINPPHHAAQRASPSPVAARREAHVEGEADLAAWVEFASAMLRPKATLTMIHRADRLDEILAALRGRFGEIDICPLWPGRAGKPAKRIILRARKGVDTPLRLGPGLVLHEADGRYTQTADAVLCGASFPW